MENKLHISVSPHIHSKNSTQRIMLDVLISLLPATIAGVVIFGLQALLVIAVCVASSVLSEFVFNKIVKKPLGKKTIRCCCGIKFQETMDFDADTLYKMKVAN